MALYVVHVLIVQEAGSAAEARTLVRESLGTELEAGDFDVVSVVGPLEVPVDYVFAADDAALWSSRGRFSDV
ncbi:MAG: hypothetical protein AB1330_01775 [Bacillota bacterium]